MELSNGEKLILTMLSEIYERLKINGEIDPQFVRKAISMNQTWALAWDYQRTIGRDEYETPPVVHEVADILEMCEMLEISYERLTPADKARVEAEAKPFGRDVPFRGFDGNNEPEHIVAADFLVNDLDRFSTFKGRDLNSHRPTLDTYYRRMLTIFRPLRNSPYYNILNAEQIIIILKAQIHPDKR